MTYQLTLYHYGTPRDAKGRLLPEIRLIEARSGVEAVRLKDSILKGMECRIREHARHVVGWSKSETKRRRKDVLHRIAWIFANVERTD